ncbi:aminopeptidase P family N-terminal domain-containing protein, partial [Bradyrhizobium guangdongense]|uniref:aminopeptidase P family N-terminal domain-containing protein n=1 Tax=Bradyrhizobium guangdongense TaxID=1325090 RepID=UPI0018F7D5D8
MQESVHARTASRATPFDTGKLDRLMEQAGLDLLLVTSKHNVQYMLDIERAIFFDYMDALGVSRYLPVVIYAKGALDKAGYVAHRMETYQRQLEQPWLQEVRISSNGSVDAIASAVEMIRRSGVPAKRIGVEMA